MASENVLPWILKHKQLIKGPALEIGSKQYREHSSLNLRKAMADENIPYLGCDLEAGDNVDAVVDITRDFPHVKGQLGKSFQTIFCISVMEHIPNIFQAAKNISGLLTPQGILFISVPFVFRFHGYPGDYWRFTPESVRYLFPDLDFDFHGEKNNLSTLAEGDVTPISSEFKTRNRFNFRPQSKIFKKIRKWGKDWNWPLLKDYSLAPTMVNMIGVKK